MSEMVENCVRVPCVYVIDRLDVCGVAVKLVVTIKASGLTWMKVENSALLGVGQVKINLVKLLFCLGDICITTAIIFTLCENTGYFTLFFFLFFLTVHFKF